MTDEPCDGCLGTGVALSGPCGCGGTGKLHDMLATVRLSWATETQRADADGFVLVRVSDFDWWGEDL